MIGRILLASAHCFIELLDGADMLFAPFLRAIAASMFVWSAAAKAQETASSKAQDIKDVLLTLCLAGGSESSITAQGNLELRAKIKDILTGKGGAEAGGSTTFTKHVWEGIIGGISKDMTDAQGQQATEARRCMIENGFPLIAQVLSSPK